MKKLILFLCSAALAASAAETPKAAPTVWQIINSPIARKAEPQLKSVKMIFRLSGKDMPESLMMLRLNRQWQFRLDSLSSSESYAIGGSQNKIWGWKSGKGEFTLNDAEIAELKGSIALLPIPFLKRDIFTVPVPGKEEYVQGLLCNTWTTGDKSGVLKVKIWTDREHSLLRKIETEFNGEIQVYLYENYRIFNGVEIASTIRQIDNDGDVCEMDLKSLQWNLVFAEKIFALPKKGELLTLEKAVRNALMKETPRADRKAGAEGIVVKVSAGSTGSKREQLEKRIGKLQIEIKAMEEQIKKMESVYKFNQDNSAGMVSDLANSRRGYWYSRGFRYSRYYSYGGSRSAMKRQVRRMEQQNRSIEKEYDKISRTLVERKIELNNVQIELKNLK